MSKDLANLLAKLPDNPGVYLFFDAKKELIYVGKATSLRSRVRSYFRSSTATPLGPLLERGKIAPTRPIEEMIHEVTDIKWKETDSVLEAIILEAQYIKKFQPKYNVDGKDDKSWNYIVISKDLYPKVETMREREYQLTINKEQLTKRFARVFGPFPGLNTKAAMKLLRRMFRFSNCTPPTTVILSEAKNQVSPTRSFAGALDDRRAIRPCLYRQMGSCPGVCTGEISPAEYRRQVIRPLVTFLSGRKKQVVKMFEAEMKRASRDERYEDAARLRDQLKSLNRIHDIALLNKSWFDTATATPSGPLLERGGGGGFPLLPREGGGRAAVGLRIEGYDISNLGASEKVGSMVVFNEDGPIKREYRKFIIKTVPGQSDVDSMAEVLERRLKHSEWPLPNLFLIDGGRPQVSRAVQELKQAGVVIPVIGIAKGKERKRNDIILGNNKELAFLAWLNANRQILISVRDEAHRFAIAFHRLRRGRLLTK